MRLPSIPNPLDLAALLPRAVELVAGAERLLRDVGGLVSRIEETRQRADALVAAVEITRAAADRAVVDIAAPMDRLVALLDSLEPPLTKLQPTLERLAETTHPSEVDAMVTMVDHLPALVVTFEKELLPVLDTLGTVAPDLHDLLDVSRELNELICNLPGIGRIKRRVEEEQIAEGRA
ncbi:hypothetical protein [uncultured Nocardioides sp.]|uniref:hypothetical protein n=1 Tax=uncultured Nocardioides sp. TaxID=198441 RepID=UPI0025F105E7|nr:hypothetical protein [uncultured Nocardioides sp.]